MPRLSHNFLDTFIPHRVFRSMIRTQYTFMAGGGER